MHFKIIYTVDQSIASKKDTLFHLISDKRQKFTLKSNSINEVANKDTLLISNNTDSTIKREIGLLNNRLNKLFTSGK